MDTPDSKYKEAFIYAPCPIMVHAEDGEVVSINKAWTQLTGYSLEDIPTIDKWTSLAYGTKKHEVTDVIDNLYKKRTICHEGEFHVRTKSGDILVWDFSSGPLGYDTDGKRLEISMALDVSERHQMEEKLKHMAHHDSLTGLYNRRELEQNLHNEINRASRYKNSFSVLMVDIDHFKSVNDTYSHQAGDLVLQEFADILKKSSRDSDYLARYGGEEFILILPETQLQKAVELAERIRKAIEEHLFPIKDNTELRLSASIGVATYPEHGKTEKEIVSAADKAMYAAKENGRNQIKTA